MFFLKEFKIMPMILAEDLHDGKAEIRQTYLGNSSNVWYDFRIRIPFDAIKGKESIISSNFDGKILLQLSDRRVTLNVRKWDLDFVNDTLYDMFGRLAPSNPYHELTIEGWIDDKDFVI